MYKRPFYIIILGIMLITLTISLTSLSCVEESPLPPWNNYNNFKCDNNTGDTLRCYLAVGVTSNEVSQSYSVYPDTMLPVSLIGTNFKFSDKRWALRLIYPFSIEKTYYVNEELSSFMNSVLPKDTLSIFFLSNDTLRKYGYIDVRENNRYLVRYDLSSSEVKQLDYTFPYPPTPEMSDMKMWPCYRDVIEKVNEQP